CRARVFGHPCRVIRSTRRQERGENDPKKTPRPPPALLEASSLLNSRAASHLRPSPQHYLHPSIGPTDASSRGSPPRSVLRTTRSPTPRGCLQRPRPGPRPVPPSAARGGSGSPRRRRPSPRGGARRFAERDL